MDQSEEDTIAPVYKGRHILITGGTGFIGKVYIEKLLRFTDIGKIYLLMRAKKGKNQTDRLRAMFDNPLYDLLKKQMDVETMISKIHIIPGDCSAADLAMSLEDRKLISDNVTLIYHMAATIRFDEMLKRAVELNTRGTLAMIKLALECKKLDMFGYVSTAYCHLHVPFLMEKPYEPPADPYKIIKSVEFLHEDEVELMAKKILGNVPNSYAFTKSLAEALVNEACAKHKLPAMILRPSIVIPTMQEPVPGWTDNLNGPAGLMIAGGKGVLRTSWIDQKSYGDFLPVDIAANALMVATWYYMCFNDKERYIINFVSSQDIKIRWEDINNMGMKIVRETYPINDIAWYPGGEMTKYYWLHKIRALFYHWIPAFFADILLFCLGYPPVLWKVHDRIAKGMDVVAYYAVNQWDFANDNAIHVRANLNKLEKVRYKCDAEGVDIYKYFENCVLGARRYLLNQPDERLPEARRMMKVMYVVDKICKTLIYGGLLYWIIGLLLPIFFSPETVDNFYSSIRQLFGTVKVQKN